MALTHRSSRTPLPLFLYLAGLLFVLLGERVLSSFSAARATFTILGLLALVASLVLRLTSKGPEDLGRRPVDRGLSVLTAVGLLAVLIALAGTDKGEQLVGLAQAAPDVRTKIEAVLIVVWVTLLVTATAPLLSAERALAPMRQSTHIESRRVLAAAASGLSLGLAAAYGALFTYTAGEIDYKIDFSYFRTARPGEATRNIIGSLREPLKVTGFFPQLSEVGSEVAGYVGELSKLNGQLQYEQQDRLMVPAVAKEAKVTQDGVLVLSKGAQKETLVIGADMQAARGKLKTLDADFQKSLLKVMREKKTAYLTVGHGELPDQSPELRSTAGVKKILELQNFAVKELGLAQGLGNEIPGDADLVLVIGPAQAFAAGEVATLQRYADRGGRLLLALDPDGKADLEPIANVVGVTLGKGILVNENFHLRRRMNDSDRAIIVTNRYSSHASVSTLSRLSSRAPSLYPSATSLDTKGGADSTLKIDFAVKTLPDTFEDMNGDYQLNGTEQRKSYNVVAAISRNLPPHGPHGEPLADKPKSGEMRAFVLGDADALSDGAFESDVNQLLFGDAVRWLGGEESFMGTIATTEDVKIEHTKEKDQVWFYGSIVGVPSLVLGLGFWLTRRPNRRTRAEARA